MPPRHTKSEFASTFFPAWLIGKNPKLKIMQVSHNTELAVRFGSKVRNLMEQPEYKQIFLEMFVYERTPKQRDVGKLIQVVNIMQRVLEPQLQVEVRTY
jgi:hypothetical protein